MTIILRGPESGPPEPSGLTFEDEVMDYLSKPVDIELLSSPEDLAFQKQLSDYYEKAKQARTEYLMNLDVNGVKIYLVGGAVREIVRGFPEKVKDWDFAVEADSFDHMRKWLEVNGFEIFLETPQYFTIRARAPKNAFSFAGIDMTGKTFDFTLCRSEGEYSDGRHPDAVQVGTIKEDLARRDFTMNAIALGADGNFIDPFDGQKDIKEGLIRCVGTTERLREDSLRMLRAIRFAIQLDFNLSNDIVGFLYDPNNVPLLENVSEERIREELTKCFKADTLETLYYLQSYHALTASIFSGDMWLLPTVKG